MAFFKMIINQLPFSIYMTIQR